MPDTKITALTAIGANPIIPSTFPIPMVDLTDTSMAASGTTKKVTVNQILGAGGTATLASATITGDLTVDTSTLKVDSANNRVGIGTTSLFGHFTIQNGSNCRFEVTSSATGISIENLNNARNAYLNMTMYADAYIWNRLGTEAMRLNSTGLGVGVTPSAWNTYKAVQVGYASLGGYAGQDTVVGSNMYYESGSFKYISTAAACSYRQNSGGHNWNVAASGTAGTAITFTQAMTLDASGNLLVGTTTNTNGSRVFARGTGGATTLAIQSSTGDTANPGLLVGKFDNDSTTSQILVRFTINNNAAGSGQITANGANAAAFGTFSDSRLKENIASIPSQLEKIVSLRPVEFDFKNGSGHQIGFVAQEMQEVYPDVVGEQDGFLTITGWSKTEARLVSAIKELAAKVQALEAKLA